MTTDDTPDTPQSFRSTDRSLPIALLRARETVMGPIRDMLTSSQISEQKWRILRVVAEAGPMDQTLIADRACLLLPSLTRILRAMESDGLLTRVQHAQDKRKSMVSITPAGRDIINMHAAQSNAIFETLEAKFGADELHRLLDLLEKLQDIDL